MQTFQFYALPVAVAEAIYRGDSTGVDVHEVTADAHPGYPCRLSLEDATVGETLYALSYEHQAAQNPYRASGPYFRSPGAAAGRTRPGGRAGLPTPSPAFPTRVLGGGLDGGGRRYDGNGY